MLKHPLCLLLLFHTAFGLHAQTCDSLAIFGNESTNAVCIEVAGNIRYAFSNNLADHTTGSFPNPQNPNTISAQDFSYRMCAYPTQAGNVTVIYGNPAARRGNCPEAFEFGVAVNGVKMDPAAAEFFTNPNTMQLNYNWRLEAVGSNLGLDMNNAHVQPSGAYHYHGVPQGLIQNLNVSPNVHSPIVGWAADGFPIYYKFVYRDALDPNSGIDSAGSCWKLKVGNRPGNGTTAPNGSYDGTYNEDYEFSPPSGCILDSCNGRYGLTPEFPNGTYYYVITDQWPYIPRCFSGTPHGSFETGPPFCTSGDNSICQPPTAIGTVSGLKASNMLVYPNPGGELLQIEFPNTVGVHLFEIEIIDSSGKPVVSLLSESGEVDVSELPAGVYFLQVSSGDMMAMKKIILD